MHHLSVKSLVTALLMIFSTTVLFSQQIERLREFEANRQQMNSSGMLVLGGWALGNLLVGGIGTFKSSGEAKYFHQFNAAWNIVNLGLATFGYLNSSQAIADTLRVSDIAKNYSSLQNLYLLNAGLDVAYVVTGFYLKERARNSALHAERLRGYGNSLLLQGGFLLVFDLAMFFIHEHYAGVQFYPYLDSHLGGTIGLGLTVRL